VRRGGSVTGPTGQAREGPSTVGNCSGNLPGSAVDKVKGRRLYSPHNGAPPAFRRDGAPAKLLTDSVTSRPISVGSLGLRRLLGVPGRGIAMIPGLFDK
jgi:hypothetical protein